MNGGLSQFTRVLANAQRRAAAPHFPAACSTGAAVERARPGCSLAGAGAPQPHGAATTTSPVWRDAQAMRAAQISAGHDAAADDAAGPARILKQAAIRIAMAQDMLLGDPLRRVPAMTEREATVLRQRMVTAMALIAATVDAVDRARGQGAA